MVWLAETIEAENFLSYSHLTWDLREAPGITAFGGLNGAGKSTMFAALCWLLYGKTPKSKLAANKVIKRGKDACSVTGVLRDARGAVTITRKRSSRGVALTISGVKGKDATIEGVQSVIDQRFGDYEVFTTTSMFSGDRSSFCKLGDSARKELLETMVGIRHYAEAGEQAKKQADIVASEIEVWDRELARTDQEIERLSEDHRRYASETFHYARLMANAHAKLVKKSTDLCAQSHDAYRALWEWLREAAVERQKVAAKRAEFEAQIDALDTEIAKVDEAVDAKRASETKLHSAVTRVEDEIARHSVGTHDPTCPTCGQRWPQDVDTGAVATLVAKLNTDLLKARCALAPTAGEIRDLREQRAEHERAKNTLARTIRDLEAAVDDSAYRQILSEALEIDAAMQQAQRTLIQFEEEHALEPDMDDFYRVADELTAARKRREEIVDKRDIAKERLEHLTFWKKGFGRNGLPAWLIDSAVPDMTEVATEIASDLTEGRLSLAFDSAASKGTGSVFEVKVDYEDGGESYEEASTGEALRVDVAVLFAIRDLAAKRSGVECGQLFLDEVTDGADDHFPTVFIRMLRNRYAHLRTFIISHDRDIPGLCDRVVKVKKTDGSSRAV